MAQTTALVSWIEVKSAISTVHNHRALLRNNFSQLLEGALCRKTCRRDGNSLNCRAALLPELERSQPLRPTAVALAPPPPISRDGDLVEGGAVRVRDDLNMLLQV
jgi:hypothetical protein